MPATSRANRATFGVMRYGEARDVVVELGLLRTGIRADPPAEERGPTRVGPRYERLATSMA